MLGKPLSDGVGETLICVNNPWYRGIRPFVDIPFASSDVLVTHMPAHGAVDLFRDEHQGSVDIQRAISTYSPLLHLTGHVHSAPNRNKIFDPKAIFSVMNAATVSINPGGDKLHDDYLKIALIDVELLRELSLSGQLTQESAEEAIGLMSVH